MSGPDEILPDPPDAGGDDAAAPEAPGVDVAVRRVIDAVHEDNLVAQRAAVEESNHWLRQRAYEDKPGAFSIGDDTEIARHLRKVLAKDRLIHDLGETYRYRESTGCWTKIPHRSIEAMVSDLSGTDVWGAKHPKPLAISRSKARDAANLFDVLVEQSKRNQTFDAAPYGLGFTNGFLTIERDAVVVRPHHPRHLCRFSYDFAYAPRCAHPMLDAFFGVVFRGESDDDKVKLPMLLQEFVGACLFGRATAYEKVLILLGPGGNGKSQFLDIARSLFPAGSLAALPPQKWSEPYSIEQLAGKLANFVDEIPEREITSHAVFKGVVSGQPTTAQRKYRDNVDFRPIAGQLWSANALFSTTDTSDGFFRRFLIVPFNWKPSQTEAKVDIGRTIGETEKRALVSWAIDGYVRLLAQGGKFTIPGVVAERTAAWTAEADRVRLFLFALFHEHAAVAWFAVGQLYDRYKQWCVQMGLLPVSKPKFVTTARASRMVVDHDHGHLRGFAWDQAECTRLMGAIGQSRPEWGEAPELPNRSYQHTPYDPFAPSPPFSRS
jgi:P4 family phage/plasmid primase-like protien